MLCLNCCFSWKILPKTSRSLIVEDIEYKPFFNSIPWHRKLEIKFMLRFCKRKFVLIYTIKIKPFICIPVVLIITSPWNFLKGRFFMVDCYGNCIRTIEKHFIWYFILLCKTSSFWDNILLVLLRSSFIRPFWSGGTKSHLFNHIFFAHLNFEMYSLLNYTNYIVWSVAGFHNYSCIPLSSRYKKIWIY